MFPNRLLLINSELRLLHANEASAGGWAHQGRVCSSSPRAPPGPRSAHASRDRRASNTGTGMTRGWQMPGLLHAPTGAPLPAVTACLAPGDRGTAVLGAVSLRHSGGWHSRASLRQQIPRSHHSYFLLCSTRSLPVLLLRPAPSGCDAEAEIRDPRLVRLPAPLWAMPQNPQPPPGTTAPSCTLGRSHSKAPAPWELINYSTHGERGSQPASSLRPCSPPSSSSSSFSALNPFWG